LKILLLNQTFYPDVASTAHYASDLAATLSERGHEVSVVCSRHAYDRPAETYSSREVWKGVEIRRIATTGLGKTAKWRRATDFGTYIANCALHLVSVRRHDIVIGMTSPPLISWIGAWFVRLKGGRFVFWVMDLNPDEAIAAGWLRDGSPVTRILQWVLKDSLCRSSLVVVLDRFMAERIARKGVDASAIATLPPWSHDDAVRYDEEGREQFRAEHGLAGKFVVMYSGNHSPCHPLTTLLEAGARLRDRSDIAFCFVGGGSEVERVRTFAAERRLPNLRVLPYQPQNRLAASLSAADLHTVVMGDRYVGILHPCKVYNIRALGTPYLYIGPAESHVTQLAPPYAARHGDVETVLRAIETEAARARSSGADRHAIFTSREVLLGRMVSLLESIPDSALEPQPSQI
jgi:hypothetical protein